MTMMSNRRLTGTAEPPDSALDMAPSPDAVPAALARLAHLPQFRSYTLGAGYDEMFDAQGASRAHYEALHDRLQTLDPQEMRQPANRGRPRVPAPGHHLHGLRAGRRHRAHLSLRPHSAHHHRRRMGGPREGTDAAHHRAQPVPEGHLQPRQGAGRRHRPARAGLQLQALPPGDAGRAGAARRLCFRRRHRPRARPRRLVCRARGQPARAERRQLHADQPAGDQARVPAAVQQLRRAAGGSLRPATAGHAARAGAATSARIRPSCC